MNYEQSVKQHEIQHGRLRALEHAQTLQKRVNVSIFLPPGPSPAGLHSQPDHDCHDHYQYDYHSARGQAYDEGQR